MADRTRVEGLKRLRQKVMQRLPDAAREEMRKANLKNADEFEATVRRIVPKGDPADGRLVETLHQHDVPDSPTAVAVTIGGPDQKHPMHLEGGHRAPDGSHVPGKPYWNPAKRVMAKRAKGRAGRALNKAVKAAAAE